MFQCVVRGGGGTATGLYLITMKPILYLIWLIPALYFSITVTVVQGYRGTEEVQHVFSHSIVNKSA